MRPASTACTTSPTLAKLEALREFLATLGIPLPIGQRLRPADLNRVLQPIAGKPVARLVNETMLRSQSQAVYSPNNLGHFGLALARYAHFTSPIRRFPDLIVHRALIAAYGLGEGGLPEADKGRFEEFGEHLSMCERRAVAAERSAMDRYVAAYMADHVGATFAGRVTSVTRFGLFVSLDGTGADGLIPIRSLGQEFFRHDEGRQLLVGERTGETYGLGDRLRVKLDEADTATGGLLFDVVEVIERVERQPPPRGHRAPAGTPRPASSCRARRGLSGQTVATTKLGAARILAAMSSLAPPGPGRFLDRDASRLARALPALRRGPAVRRLPEDAQPLPGLRAGARAVSRRRRAGLFHDLRSRPYHRPAGAGIRALRQPAAALVSCRAVVAAVGR